MRGHTEGDAAVPLRCSTALLAKCADETKVELFGRKTGHNKSAPTVRSDSNCEGLGSHQGFGLLGGLRDGMGRDQRLYKENVRPSQVKLGLLESPCLINDHKKIEMLWYDLMREIHTRCSENIAELQQFCIEEWSKMPPLYQHLKERLFLPKEDQRFMKSKGSHTFTTLHYESLHVVLNKNMPTYITVCGTGLSGPCWSIGVM